MGQLLDDLSLLGIIPAIKIQDAGKAVPLAQALKGGGLPVAEITFRTEAAGEAIRRIAQEVPDVLLGAGTVLTVEQVDRAIAAGAKFIVTPGFQPAVVAHCIEAGIPIIPGVNTPSEIEQALSAGLNTVKLFPAEQSGGADYIKAISAPYSEMRFVPTGGINSDNLNAYLALGSVLACGGTWMVKPDLIEAGRFDEITAITKDAVNKMLGFELAHIGINHPDEAAAAHTAQQFCSALGLACKPGNSSVFAGTIMECVKTKGRGRLGHIAIAANSVERAEFYLKNRGYAFEEASRIRDGKGRTKALYLSAEIGGFAIHLIRK